MIKTKLNTRTNMPRNVARGYPMGWQMPKAFYSPAYDVAGRNVVPRGADKRSTIYWNPDVKVDDTGSAAFKFNTSDGSNNYTVIIEGVTQTGEYVFSKHAIEIKQ